MCIRDSVEALVLTIQPVPWATSNVWAYEALGLFTFFRIYLVGRFVRDLAQVQAQREVLHSMQEGRAAVPLSCRLAFKVLYAQFPAATLSTVFSISYAALAFSIHVSERDVDATFDDYNNCFYHIGEAQYPVSDQNKGEHSCCNIEAVRFQTSVEQPGCVRKPHTLFESSQLQEELWKIIVDEQIS